MKSKKTVDSLKPDTASAPEASTGPLAAVQLLRIREAARIAGLSPSYLYGLIYRSEIPSHTFGKARRIALADLEAFIAKSRVAA